METYPLVVSIGGGVILCSYMIFRGLYLSPDVHWNKDGRGSTIKHEIIEEGSAKWHSHRHGWDTGGWCFTNGSGAGKKNFESVTGNYKPIFE